jgi:tetratricopeptide (TPR) repeat protein
VYGPSVQAHVIHGDIHIHQSAQFPPLAIQPPLPGRLPPNQLPPPLGRLTGRDRELAAMDAARDSRVILLTGPPGVGKTVLSISWGHQVRADFADGTLFADLHGHAADGPAGASEALGRFLRALGVDGRQVPADLAELTATYRSLVTDKRLLVVLDDALTAAQVVPLLPTSPESVAVVTSRWRLGGLAARGARVIQLGRLDAGSAVELLNRTVGNDRVLSEPNVARELVELCARLPLAICVAGARLAARPRWPLGEMVQAMAQERQRLAALTMDGDMAVQATLDISYRQLTPEVARAYRVMSLFPGTRFDSLVTTAAVGVPREEAKRLLGVLTDANLLDDTKGGQYRFHDLTRLHAREKAEQEDPAPERDEAIRRMLDWFLASADASGHVVMPYRRDLAPEIRFPPAEPLQFAGSAQALEWLDRELRNVMAAARLAVSLRLHTVAWQLADAMWPLFLHRGRYSEWVEFDRLALDAARADGDATGEAKMLYRLGLAVLDIGQPDQAERYFEQALTAWQRLGNSGRVAGSQRRLGFVAVARNRPQEAIGWFTRSLDAYRKLGSARHIALTLIDLADALIETGHAADAIGQLTEAGGLLAEGADRYNQARVDITFGRAHERAGDRETATAYLLRALAVMREIGSPRGEAQALLSLGDLAVRAERHGEARERYSEARRILVSLGSPQEARVGERLARLGPAGT